MYFEDVKLFNLEEQVSNIDEIYAHLKDDRREKLKVHMDLVYKYFLKICKDKNLNGVFLKIQNSFFKNSNPEVINLWKELLCNSIYMHDIGKINSAFQLKKMQNEKFKGESQVNSKHSMLSACIYFDYFFEKVMTMKKEDLTILILFLTLNSYIISKHHGTLEDFTEFKEDFINAYEAYAEEPKLYKNYKKGINEIKKGIFVGVFRAINSVEEELEGIEKWKVIDIYVYSKLIFSLLTDSDFYATSNFSSGKEIKELGVIKDITKYYEIYKKNGIYEKVELYKEFLKGKDKNPFGKKDINELRTQMFLESEKNLEKHSDKNIFYLEAPTGSGKTNTSINLAFKLIEKYDNLNKIFYIFPFNTLVEQTKKSLDKVFEKDEDIKRDIAVVNSITPILTKDEEEDNKYILNSEINHQINYEQSLLDRQFLHYPIVLTTHVNLFNHLFGNSREAVFPIAHLANSVVILDEIQSYKNSLWKEIIIFFKKFADILNIKIIIMSATLPRLEKLSDSHEGFVNLIEDRSKYFENPLFKNRVELDFSLLKIEDVQGQLLDMVIEKSKDGDENILIEFIKKATAMDFFKKLSKVNSEENLGRKILLITGDDNKVERNRIINLIEKEKNIVLVATQVIEAGVDIDMDIGFKDISILDAEEQFLGRINRSCKKIGSKVYFFNLDEASEIYKGDYRKEKGITLINDEIKDMLLEKNFSKFYELVMERIDVGLKKEDSQNIDEFRKEIVLNLKYEAIRNRMKLIDEDKKEYSIFLSRDIEMENGEVLSGEKVWNDYEDLLKDNKIDYAERKVKLSMIAEKMNYFIYKINKLSIAYNDIVGNIFYIQYGSKYFVDGKFDRDLLDKSETIGCDIL